MCDASSKIFNEYFYQVIRINIITIFIFYYCIRIIFFSILYYIIHKRYIQIIKQKDTIKNNLKTTTAIK